MGKKWSGEELMGIIDKAKKVLQERSDKEDMRTLIIRTTVKTPFDGWKDYGKSTKSFKDELKYNLNYNIRDIKFKLKSFVERPLIKIEYAFSKETRDKAWRDSSWRESLKN